jgi:hypothetical protein
MVLFSQKLLKRSRGVPPLIRHAEWCGKPENQSLARPRLRPAKF